MEVGKERGGDAGRRESVMTAEKEEKKTKETRSGRPPVVLLGAWRCSDYPRPFSDCRAWGGARLSVMVGQSRFDHPVTFIYDTQSN